MWYIHFKRKEYKYIVIKEHDLILHQYYITRGAKVRFKIYTRIGGTYELQSENLASRSKDDRTGRVYS